LQKPNGGHSCCKAGNPEVANQVVPGIAKREIRGLANVSIKVFTIIVVNQMIAMKKLGFLLLMAAFCGMVANCSKPATTGTEGAKTDSVASKESNAAATPQPVPDPIPLGEIQTTTGTFVSMEWGDYLHFNMKNDAGEEMSFFVLHTPEDQTSVFEKEGMEGRRIEAKWKTTMEDIPESGGKMELDQLVEVRLLD
jgi:hypothetical protein